MEREPIGPMILAVLSFVLMMHLAFTEMPDSAPTAGRMILAILSIGGLISGLLILVKRELPKYFRNIKP